MAGKRVNPEHVHYTTQYTSNTYAYISTTQGTELFPTGFFFVTTATEGHYPRVVRAKCARESVAACTQAT